MVQPTEWQVPRISLTVPASVRAMERGRMTRAISMTSSRVRLPSWRMSLTFLRSRTGSLRARMIMDEADGTIDTAAWRADLRREGRGRGNDATDGAHAHNLHFIR